MSRVEKGIWVRTREEADTNDGITFEIANSGAVDESWNVPHNAALVYVIRRFLNQE